MLKKQSREWYIDLQWGKLALVSWGDASQRPVLMVHGYMDSAATFGPLADLLPDNHYYVAVDMPGHGKSEPLPRGRPVSTAEHVEVLRRLVERLRWRSFALVTHSVGFFAGITYNSIHPHRITKMVNLDPGPPLSTYFFSQYNMPLWFQYNYIEYYDDYDRWHQEWPREYTYEEAIASVMRNRKLSEPHAALVLSRALIPQESGKYKLSWAPSSKKLTGIPISEETFFAMITQHPLPMLNIIASEDDTLETFKQNGRRMLKKLQDTLPNLTMLYVEGHHDVHISNPMSFVDKVAEFLDTDFGRVKARL